MTSKRSRAAFESDGPPKHAPFALYGTPLPAYDPEARDDGSYVPVWKQEVTDERGRKRLHGAFTGGFSAGYFNSVGSKEGWTPSTFVSSRKDRAQKTQNGNKKKQLRPEDFMDEEDLAEREEAQQLETQGAFAGLGSKTADGMSKGMFSDMFKTTGETMGVKLLQRMGWRQGQGVGAKVKRRAQGDKTGETHLFAPENTRMISFSKKTDKKGLGFAGGGSLGGLVGRNANDEDDDSDADARILSANRSKVLIKPKKLKKSSFGVGVLNDTGSDDEDPYAIGPSINYSKIIGGDKKKRKGGLVASTTTQRPTFTSSKKTNQRLTNSLEGFRRCHDGRLPLNGFVLSTKPLLILTEIRYPPPIVPQDWKPKRATKFDVQPSTFESTADAAKVSSLDAKARSALLGEAPLSGKSIFDFMTPAARDKLASASGRSNLPQARGESAPAGFEANNPPTNRTLWDLIPDLDPQTASAALHRGHSGWMPYSEDLDKRTRYTAFLTLRAGLSSTLPLRPPTWSAEEWAKELREFAQAAEVFKPISGLMATRFTSSTTKPKLATDAPDVAPAEALGKPADPAEEAARVGMYGPLTREKHLFYPTRLLCKRFGIKPPENSGMNPSEAGAGGGGAGDGGPGTGTGNLVSKAALDRMMMHASYNGLPKFARSGTEGGGGDRDGKEEERGGGGGGGGGVLPAEEERAKVDVETNDALEGEKADEGVFKSVFNE